MRLRVVGHLDWWGEGWLEGDLRLGVVGSLGSGGVRGG